MTTRGLGGLAATRDRVIVSDRILNDSADCFRCLDARTGQEIWNITYPAPGNLDYGNSPRATPLIDGERVFLFGALGHLLCARLDTGKIVWEMNLRDEFDVTAEPKWGACSSPLLVDGKLIVNPGAERAALAALDPASGKVLWKTPGRAAGYGSLIAGRFGGVRQIVGHDADSLGGWEVATGRRLWTLTPPAGHDFNVPTPVPLGERLLVCTENNRARLYQFRDGGLLDPAPLAINRRLAPDTHTPVAIGSRVFGIWRRLYCLDADRDLRVVWEHDDPAFQRYGALVASEHRALAITLEGELILFATTGERYQELGRLKVFPGEQGLYAHPALVGARIYLRGSSELIALDWPDTP